MSRFMPLKVRLVYANAMLMSRVRYGMFSFQGQTIEIKDMIFKTIIKSARFVKGNYCYKESIKSICESIGWKVPEQIMKSNTVTFTHKIVLNKEPKQVYELLRFNKSGRNSSINLKYRHKSDKQMCRLYNTLSIDLKSQPIKKFKSRLKKIYITNP